MPQRRGGHSSGTSRARRPFGWEEGPGGTRFDLAASAVTILTSALAVFEDGLTLTRLRGSLTYAMQSFVNVEDRWTGAFGIGIATSAAVTAGAAAVPTPIAEQGWDGWLFWHAIYVEGTADAEVTAMGQQFLMGERIIVDSKAQRKLRADESIYAAVEIAAGGTPGPLVGFFDSRVLVKLT